ncbi:AI-2E family transporter [Thermococci archaeon]|uniref:AI-2E family transporter n=1 Tax=Thermococcus litoralis TaxID=2265 RepID=A0A7C0TYV9_THELI|nr:AI-2E family transporter [Thermococcus sp.]MCD6140166.1 AI-2E family transporter [Thermococcus sp.]RLF78818.1 MAG: AI-2E family transporter [Thermococci archaeon]RLF88495.1 MAG: AI-2E family transporter [Thermococci archaeon]HDD31393.1 AI-2E family transporter [Thermococcus litoralis]
MKAEEILWGAVTLIILYLAWKTIAPLLSAIFFAAILAYAVLPLHKRLTKRTDNKKSALIFTILLIGLSSIVTVELVLIIKNLIVSFYGDIMTFISWSLTLELPFGISGALQSLYSQLTPKLTEYVQSYVFSIPEYLLQLVIFLATFYTFLVNSDEIKKQIYALIPGGHEDLGKKLLKRADVTLQALIRAWLLLNIAKGILMTLGFWGFGITDLPTALLAGLLTILFSFIPLFEGWMIWLVAAIFLLKQGDVLKAIAISIYGAVLVSPLPDFTIRPKLVAKEAKLDEIMVLIGMIGGVWAFGVKGLIIGPIVLNLVSALLKEWKRIKAQQS